MLTQIVGKTRLALAPMENHWWQTTLYITERGLTTSPMPYQDRTFAVDFDFIDHGLVLRTNEGATRTIPLVQRSVSDFYREYLAVLHSLEIEVELMDVPVEIPVAIPFAVDTEHRSYDGAAANRWWRVMVQVDRVLKRFRGRFEGKASPVHVFWGAFDLATTRFSGRKSPTYAGIVPNCPAYVMVEAYSRECSSCGFWPGGAGASEAAFYSYAYPEPPGYSARTVRPDGAYYDENLTCPTTSYAPPRRQTTRCSNSCKVHTKLQLISQRGTVLLWSGSNCERRCAWFRSSLHPATRGSRAGREHHPASPARHCRGGILKRGEHFRECVAAASGTPRCSGALKPNAAIRAEKPAKPDRHVGLHWRSTAMDHAVSLG